MMGCGCVTFSDSPLVYAVPRLQIFVAYLSFEQTVYSLVDRTLCCVCHSSENQYIPWTCFYWYSTSSRVWS